MPIQDALGDLDAVDLAVAYGVPTDAGAERPAARRVTLRPGASSTIREVERGARRPRRPRHPLVLRVVDGIPVTTWYRPITGPLEAEGLPAPTKPATAWYWDPRKGGYRPMSKAAETSLLG